MSNVVFEGQGQHVGWGQWSLMQVTVPYYVVREGNPQRKHLPNQFRSEKGNLLGNQKTSILAYGL